MKDMLRGVFVIAALAAAMCANAATGGGLPCQASDRDCLREAIRKHPVRHLAAWQDLLGRPLIERVQDAPPALIESLTWDNIANGWKERPRPAHASPAFIAEVKAAMAELPREINLLFADRLAGVLLVEDLGGTGFTDIVNDDGGRPVAGYVVLDAGVLQRFRANGWATWKESSPFRRDGEWSVEARIESDLQDTRKQAIQYILLHELGHVLSIGGNIHPPWTASPQEAGPPDAYPFFSLSWRVQGDRYVSHFDDTFTLRRQVSYYMGTTLGAAQAAEVYAQLAQTNFPTLYAATQPGDDFAESFANYVHVVMMGRPWRIILRNTDGTEQVIGPCWSETRCADKRRLLEQILGVTRS